MDNFHNIFNKGDKKNYNQEQLMIKQNAEVYKGSKQDKKRQITYKQKNNVWFNSKKTRRFDSKFFRVDIIDCLVIKDIKYNNNLDNYIFAVEYEHFVSYSNNGRTTEKNICILNAEINRRKKHKALYEHNLYELYGITEQTLLYELETDLHNTCHKYNLLFIYKAKGDYWTLRLDSYGVYRNYNNEYMKYDTQDINTNYYKNECRKLKKAYKKITNTLIT